MGFSLLKMRDLCLIADMVVEFKSGLVFVKAGSLFAFSVYDRNNIELMIRFSVIKEKSVL